MSTQRPHRLKMDIQITILTHSEAYFHVSWPVVPPFGLPKGACRLGTTAARL